MEKSERYSVPVENRKSDKFLAAQPFDPIDLHADSARGIGFETSTNDRIGVSPPPRKDDSR